MTATCQGCGNHLAADTGGWCAACIHDWDRRITRGRCATCPLIDGCVFCPRPVKHEAA